MGVSTPAQVNWDTMDLATKEYLTAEIAAGNLMQCLADDCGQTFDKVRCGHAMSRNDEELTQRSTGSTLPLLCKAAAGGA